MALISFTTSNADTPECHLIWFPTQLSIWFGHKIDSFSLLVFYTFYYLILSSLSSPSLPSPLFLSPLCPFPILPTRKATIKLVIFFSWLLLPLSAWH